MPTPDRPSPNNAPSGSIDREIAHHIEALTEANIAQGMSPEEARHQALIEFGGREQVRQSVREVHISALSESIAFHLKAALRFLRKSPSFSLAVILTLALGIGANSAVFSAIDAVVLRPLPYPNGDQLVRIDQHDIKGRDANHFVAPVRLEDWNRLNSTFQSISGYYLDDLSETSGQLPERVTEALVAPRFLQVMGVTTADPMAMAETIRSRIHAIEPARSVYGIMPLQQHLDDASIENRLRTTLLALFAATAVALACIGLYGTLSYLGRLRQREVGVRLALGAMRNQIVARFLAQGLCVAILGCIAGVALGLALSHFLTNMLYGITALDPVTYASVVCLILFVAALASLIPAIRAASINPVQVLRNE
jgi:hypothetical protein